eukprot:387827_1
MLNNDATTPLTNQPKDDKGKKGDGCWHACIHTRHLKSWFCFVLWWGVLALGLIFYSYFIWVWIVAILITLVEAYFSDTRQYLNNSVKTIINLYTKLNELKSERPSLTLQAECYHYETRTRTVYYTDSNGNRQSRIETYQERVTTHRASQSYGFKSWKDTSPPFNKYKLNEYELTKLQLTKSWNCANKETSDNYNLVFKQFKENNKRDAYQNYSTELRISGYNDKFLAGLRDESIPKCLKAKWFWVFTFVGLSPFYRLWVSSSVGQKRYPIRKDISILETC